MMLEVDLLLGSDPPWSTVATNLSADQHLILPDSNGTLTHMEEMTVFPAYMSLLMTLWCGLILIMGLIGNCLVLVVIWNNRDLRNSTNLFLLNLSMADILVLCVSMPTVLVEIHHPPDIWILGPVMCKLVPFVELMVAHASVLTILAISFERYYVITRPLKAGYTCTRMRALLVILAIWILGCITSSPMLFIANYTEDGGDEAGALTAQCVTQASTFWPTFYFISAICLFYFFPLLLLILIYSVISRRLMAAPCIATNHRIQVHTSANAGNDLHPNLKKRRHVVAMLGTVVVFFFICLLPFRIFTLWIILTPDEEMQSTSLERYYHALNFCRIMLYLNSAINPVLYNIMSSKFRTAFLKALRLPLAVGKPLGPRKWTIGRDSTFTTQGSNSGFSSGGDCIHLVSAEEGQRKLMRHLTKLSVLDGRRSVQKYGRQGRYDSSQGRKSVGRNKGFTKGMRSGVVSAGSFFQTGITKPQEFKFFTRNWQILKIFSVPKAWESPWPQIATYFYKFLRPAVGIIPGLRIYSPVIIGPLCVHGRNGGRYVTKALFDTTTGSTKVEDTLPTISKDGLLFDDSKAEKDINIE